LLTRPSTRVEAAIQLAVIGPLSELRAARANAQFAFVGCHTLFGKFEDAYRAMWRRWCCKQLTCDTATGISEISLLALSGAWRGTGSMFE
jgi:hypothetical protein